MFQRLVPYLEQQFGIYDSAILCTENTGNVIGPD